MIYDPEYKITRDGFIKCSRCGLDVFVGVDYMLRGLINHMNTDECVINTRDRKLKELLNKKT